MRLLASTDFALRVLIYLAAEPPDIHVSVETLARELGGLSRNHLHKVVQDLVAHGLVRTVRGKGGGVQLALPPDQIRVGAVVRHLEADQALVDCFRRDGGTCALTPRCRLKGMLGGARRSFLQSLDAHTLADCIEARAEP
jgi:Rrf2 family nitric oxide-sensitive transcriptional repressor